MSKPINENPNPAPRYPAPAIQIHPQNSRDATIARLTAEVERLRASKERLAHEASVAREWNRLRNAKRGTGILSDWQKRLSKARMNCNSHNDLAPPAKGGNDGH